MRMVLITPWVLGFAKFCLFKIKDLFSLAHSLPARKSVKETGGSIAGTGDPKRLKGNSTPYNIMLSI